ncbi:efflux RND transporter periplasmic adaptor subunit [Pseudodonghicola flavimaris]|uniref:HlyD family efflux transporter periplasmic adaptor subunit n=1 Tax=Pseudodonghicola flavimaris TaxID=3050036 RepID=A0ABT7F3J8_9RHOB|nr:HlyD family efflux transporter periplasmic adaptor subunit [Pseudodonghicola flavimaris]MDK3019187.1 HlyD family efflux transporter periplasmic adaptor subunit [Pseudodonghicola flavimaris]
MTATRKKSRPVLSAAAALLVAAALAAAFWPRPALVDLDAVRQGAMRLTIDEEGHTQVHDPYVVSSPVAGELQRVTIRPGDPVVKGETVVARMRPANPSALDVRTREQALAAVDAAEAALNVARADLNAARANRDFADSELQRVRKLVERQITSKVSLERAEQEARVAQANVDTAAAAIAMREAELTNARAQLISFDDRGLGTALADHTAPDPGTPIRAPIDGTVLRVIQKSATTLPAGSAILEIGDVARDLEIEVELLSSDAVQVHVGDPVIVTNWGGPGDLSGRVERIEPYGFTKTSALGVEEQRVKTTVGFTGAPEARAGLGHGYRVEVRIVVWQSDAALLVPSSALFRHQDGWAVFRVTDGRAHLTPVHIGHDNGISADVTEGLAEGDQVVLFPPANLADHQRVKQREIE